MANLYINKKALKSQELQRKHTRRHTGKYTGNLHTEKLLGLQNIQPLGRRGSHHICRQSISLNFTVQDIQVLIYTC